ncbi:hypothetical protein V2O64_08210 [Verrucomicrobiaceae bacterium 227]
MSSLSLRKTCLVLLAQALFTSSLRAKDPVDRSHLLAKQVNEILADLQDTKYQSKTEVDAAKGIFRSNCSGLISHLLRHNFPESYLTVRGENAPWKVRPLAVTFYETFIAAGRNEESKPGWQKVPKMMDVKPGDIIAWRKLILKQGFNTGHVCVIAGHPTLEPDGRVKVRIIDSTSGRHANDTRPPGVTGLGAGDMWFAVNEEGEPVGYWFNEKSKRSRTHKIAIGRLVPIKISGAIHPKATPSPALATTSPDLVFIGLSTEEAIQLASQRKLTSRLIVDNGNRLPVSKTIDDKRVNFVTKGGKVVRTIRG